MPFERPLDVRVAQVGIRDDRVREAGPVSGLLQPRGLGHRVGRSDGRLDVDGLGHVGAARQRDEVLGDEVPLPQLPRLRAQSRVDDVRLPVRVGQLWVLHVVEVDVRVDKLQLGHIPLLPLCVPLGRL